MAEVVTETKTKIKQPLRPKITLVRVCVRAARRFYIIDDV